MIVNTRRLTEDNLNLLEQAREELHKLLSQQIKNLESGFNDIIKRLTDKKYEITVNFENQYKSEDQRFVGLQNCLDGYLEEISHIERVFVELIEFVDASPEAQVLLKVNDVSQFMHKSFVEMEKMTKNELQQKSEIYIQPNFRPMYLNTTKALDFINKLEMVKGNNDIFNNFELKFLKKQEEDKNYARRQLEEHMRAEDEVEMDQEEAEAAEHEYAEDPMLRPPRDVHRQQHGGGIESQLDDRASLKKPKVSSAGGGSGSAGPGSGQEHTKGGRGGEVVSGSETEGTAMQKSRTQVEAVYKSNQKKVIFRKGQGGAEVGAETALNEGGRRSGREEQKIEDETDKQATALGATPTNKQLAAQAMALKAKQAAAAEAGKIKDYVYYFGPSPKVIRFNVRTRAWDKIKLETGQMFRG